MITFTKSHNKKIISKQVLNNYKNIKGPEDYRFADKPFLKKYTNFSSLVYLFLSKYFPKFLIYIPKKIFGYLNNILYVILLDKTKFNKLLKKLN